LSLEAPRAREALANLLPRAQVRRVLSGEVAVTAAKHLGDEAEPAVRAQRAQAVLRALWRGDTYARPTTALTTQATRHR